MYFHLALLMGVRLLGRLLLGVLRLLDHLGLGLASVGMGVGRPFEALFDEDGFVPSFDDAHELFDLIEGRFLDFFLVELRQVVQQELDVLDFLADQEVDFLLEVGSVGPEWRHEYLRSSQGEVRPMSRSA